MTTLAKKLTWNIMIQFSAKAFNILMAILLLGILSRYLGVAGMGEYGTILRYLGFIGILTDLGLNVIVAREIAKKNLKNKQKILSNAFGLRIFSSLIFFSCAWLILIFLPYSPTIKTGVLIGSIGFLFILWTQIFNGVFQKYLITHQSSLADFLSKAITLLLTFYLIQKQADLLTILWALVAGCFTALVLTLFYVNKHYPLGIRFDLKIWQKLIQTAWPVALSNFFILIYFNIDALMLSWMRPMEEVGYYHVAYKILETFFQFIVLFVGLFVPLLAQSLLDKIYFKKHLQAAFNGVLFFGLPLFFLGMFFAHDIIILINGANFLPAVSVLQILFLSMFFLFINHLIHNAITVLDLQKKFLWIYALGALFNLVANLYAISHYGMQGAAFTTLLSEFLICLCTYFAFQKQTGDYPNSDFAWKIVGVNLLVVFALILVGEVSFLIKFFLTVFLYFGLVFLMLERKDLS